MNNGNIKVKNEFRGINKVEELIITLKELFKYLLLNQTLLLYP